MIDDDCIPYLEPVRSAREALAGALPAESDPRRPRREVHPEAVARARQSRALPQPSKRNQGRSGEFYYVEHREGRKVGDYILLKWYSGSLIGANFQ